MTTNFFIKDYKRCSSCGWIGSPQFFSGDVCNYCTTHTQTPKTLKEKDIIQSVEQTTESTLTHS